MFTFNLHNLWKSRKTSDEEKRPEGMHDHELILSVVPTKKIPRARQFRYLFLILSPAEQRIFLIAFVVFFLSMSVAGFRYITSRLVSVPVVGGSFTEALVGQPTFLNPVDALTNPVDRDLVRLIFSGLFRFDGLTPVPDLADKYEWSEDRKTLTVHLRQDAQFHSGEPVTANDVQFTYDSIQDPLRKSPLLPIYQGVQVTAVDDATITFELKRPDATFLTKLTVGILPSGLWQDIQNANARLSELNIRPVGSGPYRVKNFTRDNLGAIHSYTLERYDRFYGDKPYLKTLIFQFFGDRTQALESLKGGLVESLSFVSTADALKFDTSSRKKDIALELPQTMVAYLNTKDKTLSNKDVRQALSLATNRIDLVRALESAAVPVTGPYPFDAVSSTEPDVDRARTLLTNAGWVLPPDGNVRIWSPPKPATSSRTAPAASSRTANDTTQPQAASSTELTLTISVPDEPDLLAVAEVLKRQWSLLGAKVSVDPLPLEELKRRATRERTLSIVLLNTLLGPELDIFPFWSSQNVVERRANLSNLADRGIDEALERIDQATSTEALAAARTQATAAIQKMHPAIFLVRPTQHYIVSANLHLPREQLILSFPSERFQDISQWYIKTGLRWR